MMANRSFILLGILCIIFLGGCSQYWYQEGVSYRQCQKDRNDCFRELQKRTDFGNSGGYEFEFMAECMRQKGYRLVTAKELPMGVKRTEPETSLHWRAKGLAGTIDE